MRTINAVVTCLICLVVEPAFALQPGEILVIANSDADESVRIAQYYCAKRQVPKGNILALSLGKGLGETIERDDYNKRLAQPIRERLLAGESGQKIKCLLTTYGVPIKVEGRGMLKGQEDKLSRLREQAKDLRSRLEQIEQSNPGLVYDEKRQTKGELTRAESEIDRLIGKETAASVDSELSLLLRGDYELYRWQPNELKNKVPSLGLYTLMVSRLDGPHVEVVKGLINKAVAAEEKGLQGTAYIDSRGLAKSQKSYSPGYFDQSLRDLALLTKFRTTLAVKEERTDELFQSGACPQTAIYCGWYSLQKYVDAFDFVEGAVGYHIASLEAVDLRDPNSSQWCPAMLADGVTATLGAVAEPYLHSFPEPKEFFRELFSGYCLVEAYYRTKPFNSWQMVLIGDPLYRPFQIR